jgi:hypothetical protein
VRAVGRSPSGRYYQWSEVIAEASKFPHIWQTLLPNAPATVVYTIRYRRSAELRREDGHLEARARNEYIDERGKRRANVDVRWVPTYDREVTNPEEESNGRAEK